MNKRLASLAAVGLAAGMALAACGGDDDGDGEEIAQGFEDCLENPADCNSGEAQEGGTMTWVVSVVPDMWFTIDAVGGSVYSLQTIGGIMAHTGGDNPAGEYTYNMDLLAAEPELLSEEPWSFQFQLREEAVWSDGTPITVDDFRALWYLSAVEKGFCEGCNPRGGGAGFDDIESIEGSDGGKTVTITMTEGNADPEWFNFGSTHGIAGGLVPWHIAVEQGYDWEDPASVGEFYEELHNTPPTWSGGPYQIVADESDLGTQVIWERNENYYGELAPLDTVVIRYLTDDDGWVQAFASGEMDGVSPPDINVDLIEQLQGQEGVRLNVSSGPSWEHLDVNLGNTQLADVELRRAIFTAVDVDDIADANFGEVFPEVERRLNYSFNQNSPNFVDHFEGTGFGSGDVEAARGILEAAGYEGFNEGETLTLDGETIGPFRLTSTDTAPRSNAKLLVQDYLSQIGIAVEIEVTETLGATLVEADYDLIIFGWSGPASLFANNAFQYAHSGSSSNFGGYDNPAYDDPADRATVAPSPEDAAAAANEAYAIMVPDAYILPFYNTPVYIAVTEEYVNVRDNGNSSLRALYNAGQWGVAVE